MRLKLLMADGEMIQKQLQEHRAMSVCYGNRVRAGAGKQLG